ncbi:hypothetical protein C8F01DRAFT_1372150 [Mycena amicta]|nr:hypothetical protein C8F01DRAFT_1372150 [Mycena amicta]
MTDIQGLMNHGKNETMHRPGRTQRSGTWSRAVVGGSDGHFALQSRDTSSLSEIISPLKQWPDSRATSSASCSEQRRDKQSARRLPVPLQASSTARRRLPSRHGRTPEQHQCRPLDLA